MAILLKDAGLRALPAVDVETILSEIPGRIVLGYLEEREKRECK